MILHRHLPYTPWEDARLSRLPGILPAAIDDWLRVDEAYGAQMAERARLIKARPEDVHALSDAARPAAQELLEQVLAWLELRSDFAVLPTTVLRPDGISVPIDRENPLLTLGALVQEDLCLMQPDGQGAHMLTGAILCFPASWTLREKYMQPLVRIHAPVAPYTENMAIRVQRLFDALKPRRVLWRANAMTYETPDLFQPRPEAAPHAPAGADAPYVRSERQTIVKLPQTGAAVFAIHTYVIARTDLTPQQRESLTRHLARPERTKI